MKADTVLQLTVDGGQPFKFSRFEVPEAIQFGGRQKLAVHELIGGARVVDAMGRSDMPLQWSGLFQGKTALERARYLDYLRISGKPCKLTWSELSFTVVVEEFTADFQRAYQIPYRIICLVVKDEAQPVTVIANPGIDELIAADISAADAASGNYSNIKASMQKVKAAYKSIKKMAKATTDQIKTLKTTIKETQEVVKREIASVANTAKQITTLGGLVPNNNVAKFASKATSQATAMTQQAELHNIQSTLGRLGKNVGKA
jgi:hypothetical protein